MKPYVWYHAHTMLTTLNPLPLEGGRTTDPRPKLNLHNGLQISLEFWVLLTILADSSLANQYSLLTHFSPV